MYGLSDVTAIGVAAAGVTVLIVVVVGSRLGVRILNLVEGRRGEVAVAVAERERIGVAEHNVIGARSAHH